MTEVTQAERDYVAGMSRATAALDHVGTDYEEGRADEYARRVIDYIRNNPLPDAQPDAVAQLVEAAREAREALHFHYTEWDGEPEDAVPLQLARGKLDAALANLAAAQQEGNG